MLCVYSVVILKSFSSFLHRNKLFFSFSLIFALPPSVASYPYLSVHVLSVSQAAGWKVAIETELFKRRAKKLHFSLPTGSYSFHSAHLISLPPFFLSVWQRHTHACSLLYCLNQIGVQTFPYFSKPWKCTCKCLVTWKHFRIF